MLQKGQASQAVKETLEPKLTGVPSEIARLRRELSTKEEQVRNLIRDTLDTQEAERERICLEVHDGVTQTLASMVRSSGPNTETLTQASITMPLSRIRSRTSANPEGAIEVCTAIPFHLLSSLRPFSFEKLHF